jgi:chromosome segregation and condensation protein ScpB
MTKQIAQPLPQLLLCALVRKSPQSVSGLMATVSQAGIPCSPQSVEMALLDLETILETSPQIPFRLTRSGNIISLVGKTDQADMLLTGKTIQVFIPLEPIDLEVLAVIVFRAGATPTSIENMLRKDPTKSIARLHRAELIAPVPCPHGTKWLPTDTIRKRFGLESLEEIPGYHEYRAYLENSQDQKARAKAQAASQQALQRKRSSKKSFA